jgi:DNA polymerase-1
MRSRTVIVHATNLLARGFVAESTDRRADDGRPTNALFGVTRALLRAIAFKEPEHAVAVVDDTPTDEWPPLLKAQLPLLGDLLEAHGMHVVSSGQAADLVASYVQSAIDHGHDVVVVGSDKRLAQLVGDSVWWYDAYKDVRYTPELVRKRFEVGPTSVAEWLALVGDDDTLPGIKGIGKKGATGLLETYGSVSEALAHVDEVKGRTGNALRAAIDETPKQLQRARLQRDVALPVSLISLTFAMPTTSALNDLYRQHGFYALLEADDDAPPLELTVCDTVDTAQHAITQLGDKLVAVHALFEEPSPGRGVLVGVALSAGGGQALYFPLAGKGQCLDSPDVLGPWLADPNRPKVGHDVKAAVVALARCDIAVAGIVGDAGCASHLEQPSGWAPHDLPLVARSKLARPVEEDNAVLGVGRRRKRWSDLDVAVAGAFAGKRADVAMALWRAFEPGFEEPVQRELLDEYLALSETLARMEGVGMACDADDLAGAGDDFAAIEAGLETEIYEHAGKSFNLGSTKQLGSVLYEDLGLPVVKRTKTGWSTATPALERLEHAHPIVSLVIRWRRLRRLRDTWVTALRASIDADGRVRSTFHPARSFSGRLVNSNPDMGRVPGRTPEMARIRHAFRAPVGKTLLSVDYNQLGLYVLAHLTRDPALVDPLQRGDDMHTLTASAVLELPREAIGTAERQIGKVVNFATFAGQGASALALQLGVSAKEAKQLIARFDQRYAVVRTFQDGQLELARERGYIETIAGRRWPIGALSSLDVMDRSYAERLARRATHEGSVADVTRRGLLHADRALREAGLHAFPLLQILDEVLFEVPNEELADVVRIACDAMCGAFDLVVPLQVGCKAGANWAELTPLASRAERQAV